MITFNLDDGFAEAIVRGFKSGILSQADYSNLGQCDSLEGYVLSCYTRKSLAFGPPPSTLF